MSERKIKLSDHDIDIVLRLVAHCYDLSKQFRGDARKNNFLKDLHMRLHDQQSGILIGVCPECFGSGYKNAEVGVE